MNVTLRRSLAAAAVVLTAPALASCGFNYPTDQVYTPSVGVNDRDGDVDVLHALVVSGAEGSGTVVAALVNNQQEDDALTEIAGSGPDASVTVSSAGSVEVPGTELVQLAEEEIGVEGESIAPGQFVELTFSFQNAESVTVEVPVVARRGDYAEIPVPSEEPTAEETPPRSRPPRRPRRGAAPAEKPPLPRTTTTPRADPPGASSFPGGSAGSLPHDQDNSDVPEVSDMLSRPRLCVCGFGHDSSGSPERVRGQGGRTMSDLGRPSRKGPWAVGVAALLALAMVFVAPTSATAGRSATANKTGSAVVAKSDQGTLRSAISGTTSDGRRVSGTFTPMKFVEQDGALAVEGVIDGVIRGKGAPETFSAVRTLTVQEVNTPDGALPLGGKGMPGAAAAGACDILNLVLGPWTSTCSVSRCTSTRSCSTSSRSPVRATCSATCSARWPACSTRPARSRGCSRSSPAC